MALPQYDSDELIDNIKRRCSVPTSQLTYTDADFVALANDELRDEIIPLMMSVREEYFVDHVDSVIPSDGIIAFPEHAIGAKLRSVCIVQQTSPMILRNLPRIDLDVIAGIGSGSVASGFYIEGNNLKLYPNADGLTGQTIRVYFFKRSLVLAAPTAYAKITAIDAGTNTITISRTPSGWATNTILNSVSSQPNFGVTNEESVIVSVSSPDVVVSTVVGMAVGDWISDQGYSAVPQAPIEAHGYLAQLTAAKCLEGLGDREGMKAALEKADKLKIGLLTVISQRVDGSVKKVVAAGGGLRYGAGLNGKYGR